MSPGTYLRKRREAAGVTIERAALALIPGLHSADLVDQSIRAVVAMENDSNHVTPVITKMLARAFPLDPDVYDALMTLHFGATAPLPNICGQCACSFHDPCHRPIVDLTTGAGNTVCGWADGSATICTFCAEVTDEH